MAKSKFVGVIGGKELQKALSGRLEALEKGLEAIAHAGADPIRAEAIRRAPKRTRNLAEHIEQETLEKKADIVIVGVGPDDKEAFYGRFVELGTTEHEVAPGQAQALQIEDEFAAGATPTGATPRPYLRPALDEKHKQAAQEMARELKKRLGL